jgi:hypothetical protein
VTRTETTAPTNPEMKDFEDKPLSEQRSPDGKEIVSLEEFLQRHLKHPEHETETLRLNATNILKVLGMKVINQREAKRANKWLRAHGFKAVHNGTVYTVGLVDTQAIAFYVV